MRLKLIKKLVSAADGGDATRGWQPPDKGKSMRMMQQDRVRLRSAIPGRSRWDVDVLKHRSRKAARVELELKNLQGVQEVTATSSTGRVLILYDVDISLETVGEWLQAECRTYTLA